VNSAMAARCLCCLADQGSEIREIAVTSGLWSVHSWKSRPSRICLICLIVWAAERSSRSNVEYLVSATLSLRERKPNGCQEPLTCWFSTLPMCVSEASVATEMAAATGETYVESRPYLRTQLALHIGVIEYIG
jgi:hypothetical protein